MNSGLKTQLQGNPGAGGHLLNPFPFPKLDFYFSLFLLLMSFLFSLPVPFFPYLWVFSIFGICVCSPFLESLTANVLSWSSLSWYFVSLSLAVCLLYHVVSPQWNKSLLISITSREALLARSDPFHTASEISYLGYQCRSLPPEVWTIETTENPS